MAEVLWRALHRIPCCVADKESGGDEEDIGMEYLLHPEKNEEEILSDKDDRRPTREITDIAAAAQSLQPTGYTLETTVVSGSSQRVSVVSA